MKQLREIIMKGTSVHELSELDSYRSYTKLKENLEQLPVKKLLTMFTQLRGTGTRKPGGRS